MQFSNLPLNFNIELIKYWIDNNDIVKLDTAITNIEKHKKLYKLPYFKIEREFILSPRKLRWIVKNRIKLTNLHLNYFNRLLKKYLQNDFVTKIKLNSKMNNIMLNKVIINSSNLLIINFESCSYLEDNTMIEISKHCPNLTSLNISGCKKVKDESLITVLEKCEFLEELNISNTNLIPGKIIKSIKNCKNLTNLNIKGINSPFMGDIIELIKQFPKISYLGLDGDLYLSSELYKNIPKDHSNENGWSFINYLTISRDFFDSSISKIFPNLLKLNCSHNQTITDDILIETIRKCPKLTKLDISNCFKLTDRIIDAIIENLPNLTYIDISSLNFSKQFESVDRILSGCKKISSFYNWNCFLTKSDYIFFHNKFKRLDVLNGRYRYFYTE